MNSQYSIQTVPHNLNKEETIVQMVEILDHLNAITQDIFSRVNKRLDLNTEKLSSISKRIDTASCKLESLKGDKKAKTVFSSSKYPAVDVNRDYVSIFKEKSNVERVTHKVKNSKYVSTSVSTYEPLSKLQFYHVKMPDQKNMKVPEGLGAIPGETKCINDLLLFNTGKNIYKDFRPSDTLKGPEIVNYKEHYTTSELGAAPLSISQRSSLQQASKDNYFYTPKIEEIPALDVPWDLPDLPGIADDVRYEVDSGFGIASSSAPSTVNDTQISDLDLPSILEIKLVPDRSPTPPQDIPKPPPIDQMDIQVPEPSITNTKSVELIETVDYGSKQQVLQDEAPSQTPPAMALSLPHTDSRSSLMDAIRKAGGSQNLRKTNERSQTNASKTTTASSGDLMADLHSKLMMRRKGISGAKNVDQANSSNLSTADSAFQRLSSIIPPPTKSSDIASTVSTDDEAWNDDDDE